MNRSNVSRPLSSKRGSRKRGNPSLTLAKRAIIYGVLILVLCAAQCSFFSVLKPFGATPDIILGMLIGIILLDSPSAAAVCALVAGYVIDSIGAVPPSFSPIYYLACVAMLAILSAKMLPRFLSYCLLMVAALVGRALFTLINICISSASLPTVSYALTTILSEALSTFVFCLPIYFIMRLCARAIGARQKFDFS